MNCEPHFLAALPGLEWVHQDVVVGGGGRALHSASASRWRAQLPRFLRHSEIYRTMRRGWGPHEVVGIQRWDGRRTPYPATGC